MTRRAPFQFRLYIAGGTLNSSEASANLMELCQEYLPERHSIEIVDVFDEPSRALADNIFMTPTTVRLAPAPVRRIVGTLAQVRSALQALGLDPKAP
jgi:circadian clock protein KaiB